MVRLPARHEHEREAAEHAAAGVPNVAGIKDHILVDRGR